MTPGQITSGETATCRCGKPLSLVTRQAWTHADGKTYRHRVEVADRDPAAQAELHRVGDGFGILVVFGGRPHALVLPADDGSADVLRLGVIGDPTHHADYDEAVRHVVDPGVRRRPDP